jgi:transcriptional regulator with XRE-family HTH domain
MGSDDNYNELVGSRLRTIRKQRGLSLQDVQRISAGEFKAAVLGAYERGERSLSLPRLHRLAAFYNVPITQMLPPEEQKESPIAALPTGGLTIDLNTLDRLSDPEAALFERFLRAIQTMRQDFNGKVLTIRREDLRTIALLLDEGDEALADQLNRLGLAAGS